MNFQCLGYKNGISILFYSILSAGKDHYTAFPETYCRSLMTRQKTSLTSLKQLFSNTLTPPPKKNSLQIRSFNKNDATVRLFSFFLSFYNGCPGSYSFEQVLVLNALLHNISSHMHGWETASLYECCILPDCTSKKHIRLLSLVYFRFIMYYNHTICCLSEPVTFCEFFFPPPRLCDSQPYK